MNAVRAFFVVAFLSGVRNQWRDLSSDVISYFDGRRIRYTRRITKSHRPNLA